MQPLIATSVEVLLVSCIKIFYLFFFFQVKDIMDLESVHMAYLSEALRM